MKLRTFFLVTASPGIPLGVRARFTCPDIRQQLVVEQVSARLTGQPITIDSLVESFPEAVQATHQWHAMKAAAHRDNSMRGPFIVVTDGEDEPSDEDLLAWYTKTTTTAITAGDATDTQRIEDAALAATGFLRPVIDRLVDVALADPHPRKTS